MDNNPAFAFFDVARFLGRRSPRSPGFLLNDCGEFSREPLSPAGRRERRLPKTQVFPLRRLLDGQAQAVRSLPLPTVCLLL